MPVRRERLNLEQQAFVEAIDDFCARECPPHELRKITEDGTIGHHRELYAKLAATGWLGLTIPEEYGGSGGTLRDVALLTERLAYHRVPVGGYLTSVITLQALVKFGTERQKKEVLPAVADGSVLSIAITEPDSGSDAASVRTAARRDGDRWLINGEKLYTSNANHASWVLVVTRTDPEASKHRGISLFLVPIDRVEVTDLRMLGHIDTTITRYVDVPVTEDDLVGGLDQGWRALVQGLNSERLILGADALGLGQRAFDDTLRYVTEREQFGQPVPGHPARPGRVGDPAPLGAPARRAHRRAPRRGRPGARRGVDDQAAGHRGRPGRVATGHAVHGRDGLQHGERHAVLRPRHPGHDHLRWDLADPEEHHRRPAGPRRVTGADGAGRDDRTKGTM